MCLFSLSPGTVACAATALLSSFAQPASAVTVAVLPDFSAAVFDPGAPIDNRYFPLNPRLSSDLEASGVDAEGAPGRERSELRFGGAGPVIKGIQTTTLLDRAFEFGRLVEETLDFYAQDTRGNVWYMGEDVTNYNYDEDGNLIGTDSDSSWRAGVNDALPGFAMPVEPAVGFAYYQEFAAADEALDEGLIHGFLDVLDVEGVTFQDVLQVFETSALDPALREIKYYAPGIGLIRADEGLDADLRNPDLTFTLVAPIPVPAAFPLLATGVVLLAAAGHRRRQR